MNNSKISYFLAVCLLPLWLLTNSAYSASGSVKLDKAPNLSNDMSAIQQGAKMFMNYCFGCHGLSLVSYNQLTDIGLSEQQIKDNLLFGSDKLASPIRRASSRDDMKKWFGVAPPDLSLIARARSGPDGSGADWVYTFLRAFYQDDKNPNGWNNRILPNSAMPNVLHRLQDNPEGTIKPDEADRLVANLVAFLSWASDPHGQLRKQIGVGVLLFLFAFFWLAYALKKEYWRDIK